VSDDLCGQSLPQPKVENVDSLERRLTWLVRKQKEHEKALAANLHEQEVVKRKIRKAIMKRMPKD
jgi:hypothetical protein